MPYHGRNSEVSKTLGNIIDKYFYLSQELLQMID